MERRVCDGDRACGKRISCGKFVYVLKYATFKGRPALPPQPQPVVESRNSISADLSLLPSPRIALFDWVMELALI